MSRNLSFTFLPYIFLAGVALVYFVYSPGTQNVNFEEVDGDIQITDSSGAVTKYTKTGEEVMIEGYALASMTSNPFLQSMGIAQNISYLSMSDYEELVSKYESINRCPARFLSSRNKVISIVKQNGSAHSIIADNSKFRIYGTSLQFLGHKTKTGAMLQPGMASGFGEYFFVP